MKSSSIVRPLSVSVLRGIDYLKTLAKTKDIFGSEWLYQQS